MTTIYPWLAWDCALQGHVVYGYGWNTNPAQTVWANYCSRCGEKVRLQMQGSSQ